MLLLLRIPGEVNAFSSQEIYNTCKKLKINCVKKKNVNLAKKYLINNLNPEQIIITGSLYLIGKTRKLFF